MRKTLQTIALAAALVGLAVLFLTGSKTVLAMSLGVWVLLFTGSDNVVGVGIEGGDSSDGQDAQGLNVRPVNFHPLAND